MKHKGVAILNSRILGFYVNFKIMSFRITSQRHFNLELGLTRIRPMK